MELKWLILLFTGTALWRTANDLHQPPVSVTQPVQQISIYLTFDDGPMTGSGFLDSLTATDSIPVDVFLIGAQLERDEKVKRIFQQYQNNPFIEIANHSYSHASGHYRMFYSSPEKVVGDILVNEKLLRPENNFVRLPGRNTWRIANRKRTDLIDANLSADSLSKLGFQLIGWDMEWRFDSTLQQYFSAERMITCVKSSAWGNVFEKGHVVILCHDWMLPDPYFREQLILFVKMMRAAGIAEFLHLNKYPGIKKGICRCDSHCQS
ncbi:MAG: polysaccharide deacetylase family protein [Chitinophagaceae bacterium]